MKFLVIESMLGGSRIEMKLPDYGGFVVLCTQELGEKHVRAGYGHSVPPGTVTTHIAPGKQACPTRSAKRALGIRPFEYGASSGQPVDVWCLNDIIPIVSDHIRPHLIHHDPENVFLYMSAIGMCHGRYVSRLIDGGSSSGLLPQLLLGSSPNTSLSAPPDDRSL